MRGSKAEFTDTRLPDYPSRVYGRQRGWKKLEVIGTRIHIDEGRTFIEQEDEIEYCYLIHSGRVISFEYTEEGTEHIFNIFEEGSLFLESNVLFGMPAAVSFKTMIPTELVRISRAQLITAMEQDVNIALFAMESTTYKYYSAMDQIRESTGHDAAWKVSNLLNILATNFGEEYDSEWIRINLKLNQQTLGNLLSMNRVTVSKIIKDLKDQKSLLQVNGCYCIRK